MKVGKSHGGKARKSHGGKAKKSKEKKPKVSKAELSRKIDELSKKLDALTAQPRPDGAALVQGVKAELAPLEAELKELAHRELTALFTDGFDAGAKRPLISLS